MTYSKPLGKNIQGYTKGQIFGFIIAAFADSTNEFKNSGELTDSFPDFL